jgi:hypothetical protein
MELSSILTEELSETRRVSFQNKFEKLVHLVGFIIRKFVTMHGHMNVKKIRKLFLTGYCLTINIVVLNVSFIR